MRTVQAVFMLALIIPQVNNPLYAQDPPITWGKVLKSDLEMTSYPKDSNAAAVILCDYGETYIDDELNLVYKRHLRVKILSTRGYEWGTHSVLVNEERDYESIHDIKGMTYSLDAQGNIQEKELDDDDVIRENVTEKYYRYFWTLPGLSPGCIIETRYRIVSEHLFLVRDWTFQYHEPVAWSEYRIRHPKSIGIAAVSSGYQRFEVNEEKESIAYYSGSSLLYLGHNPVSCLTKRWAVRDAPAIHDEPFITTTKDYVNKVDVQLTGYAFAGMPVQHVLNDWKVLVNELADSKWFGDKIEVTGDVRKYVAQITTGLTTPEEKIKAIYDWVAASIVWDEKFDQTANQDVDDVLETKKGNNAEVSFLLISLLRAAGIQTDPVLLSTRPHGRAQDLFPIISQFDYIIARAQIGNRSYLLDATNPLRPFTLLPKSVLNVNGLVIKKNVVQWVDVTVRARSVVQSSISLSVTGRGSIRANVVSQFCEYAALDLRNEISEKKDTDIAKRVFDTEASGFVVDSVAVTGQEQKDSALIVKGWLSSDSYAQTTGDILYINPHIIRPFKETPFKLANRTFPVDYGYGRQTRTDITLVIPKGFELKEKFPDHSFFVGRDAIYTRRIEVRDSLISVYTNFEIKIPEFSSRDYIGLKQLYASMIAWESEQIVLQRISPPPPPVKQLKKKATSQPTSGKEKTKKP